MSRLEHVISGLGTERFCTDLLRFAGSLSPVDHAAVIRFDSASRARIVASATRESLRINGGHVRDAYERRFYRADPNQALLGFAAAEAGTVVRRLRPGSLADENYRFHCFELPALVDRLSVVTAAQGFLYCVNLYRCACTGPFSEAGIEAIRACSAVLAALTVKNDQIAHRAALPPHTRADRLADLAQRLAAIQPRLTRRERDVAARIVLGMSSDAIALELGITPNSAVTYRKRAYSRLGIASQNELFALCYFG